MTWWQAVPALAGALALMFIPGYLAAKSCGTRGITACALAAPLTITIMSTFAIVANIIQVSWSVWVVAIATALTALAGIVTRRLWHRFGILRNRAVAEKSSPPGSSARRPVMVRALTVGTALTIPAVIIGLRLKEIFIRPDNISQSYDGVFHLNALQYVADSGSASSLTLGGMPTDGESTPFYPAAWHAYASLVVQITGSTIPVAATVTSIVIAAVVWPLSCLFLCTRLTGNRPIPLLVTGVLAAAFPSFPYLLLDFGVLYPNFLSIAILPTVLGLLAMALRLSADNQGGVLLPVMALLGVLPGVALAHPSTLMAFLAFAVPMTAVALVRDWRRLHARSAPAGRYLLPAGLLLAYLSFTVLLWFELRPSEAASGWEPYQTRAHAIGEVLASAPLERPVAWIVMTLTIAGLLHVAMRRGGWWAFGIFIVGAFLFMVVSAFPQDDFRSAITGAWYNDSFRLAALLPVTTIMITMLGGTWIVSSVVRRFEGIGRTILVPWRVGRSESTVPAALAGVVVLALLVMGTQGSAVDSTVATARKAYVLSDDSPLLSTDELTLIQRVPNNVPDDAVIIGNAWTGTALVYALTGIPTLTPHLGSTGSPETEILLNRMHLADSDPEICTIAEQQNSYYVLDFDGPELHVGDHVYPGVEDLEDKAGYELVDSEGDAGLYELTACGP
ncbi:DUF6541 family protein [Arthrobacter sp. H5]|uniref:DUF6541 family protein n=1 Tax=Arthrobacter sp. H5 TaxID=1267973 RepID=UPI000486FE34|nr:DUF6541 family protein [Arthrobacter sp. H5]